MARRKRKVVYRRRPVKKRVRRRRNTGRASAMAHFTGGIGYGFLRQWLSQLIRPFTQKIPFGEAGDNIGMGLALYFGKKYIRNPTARRVLDAGLAVEGAMLGEELKSGKIGFNTTNTNASTGSYPV